MECQKKEELNSYNGMKNIKNDFDFQKEMKDYCISDVDILSHTCLKFRDLLKSETGEEAAWIIMT